MIKHDIQQGVNIVVDVGRWSKVQRLLLGRVWIQDVEVDTNAAWQRRQCLREREKVSSEVLVYLR